MKISRIQLGMLRVPLKTPFRTALRTVERIEDIVVRIHCDSGETGHGEAPATAVITGDTHGSIIDAIRNYIGPQLVGEEVADLNRLVRIIQGSVQRNCSAKAAMEIAVHDLFGQLHQAPLYQLLGGGTPRLHTDITISLGDVDKMVADSLDAVEAGYDSLKVKLGTQVENDIARVLAIHEAVGRHATLRLDPNQAWTPKEAVRAMQLLEAAGVRLDLLEQPVKASDLAGLLFVRERIQTPLMADESAFGPLEALELIRLRAVDIINIKLMKSGGISRAMRVADIASIHGVQCMMGCMLESSISVAAAVHVAVARADVITRVDLDGPSLGTFDPVTGAVDFAGPTINVGNASGLGIGDISGLEMFDD